MSVTIFDLPDVVAEAATRLSGHGLSDRIQTVGGSFKDGPLPTGFDVVTLVRVLHDHDDPVVEVETQVRATARTGVEMEALVAATAAVLAVYDMTKSIDPGMTIETVRLEEKTGGTRGDYLRGG